jgi:hypothetical protein
VSGQLGDDFIEVSFEVFVNITQRFVKYQHLGTADEGAAE